MSKTQNPSREPLSPVDPSDMEIVRDFNDLNLEIVTNTPAPREQSDADNLSIDDFTFEASKPSQTSVPSAGPGLSIDDFTFETPTSAPVKVAKTRDEWFTKVLGQTLGPFPFEKLIEMVSQEEVGRQDQIRHGSQPWIVAGEIEGLFPEESDDDDDFELGVVMDLQTAPSPAAKSTVAFKAVGGEINRAMSQRSPRAVPDQPVSMPVESSTEEKTDSESASPSPAAEKPVPVKLTREEKEALRKEKIAARLNEWLADKVQTPDPEPVTDEPEQESATAATSPAAPAGYSAAAATGFGNYQPGSPANAAFGGAARPLPPQFKKPKSSGGSMFGGLGSMFSSIPKPEVNADPKIFIALGAIALVFALMYVPSMIGGTNDQAVYDRLKEIYAQVEQLRANNPAQLSSFATGVIPEIEKTVDELEKDGAGSKKPVKQQLFWAGKNCLIPLLKSPPAQPGDFDNRFKTHMETAGRMLGDPTVPPLPPPVEVPPSDDMSSSP